MEGTSGCAQTAISASTPGNKSRPTGGETRIKNQMTVVNGMEPLNRPGLGGSQGNGRNREHVGSTDSTSRQRPPLLSTEGDTTQYEHHLIATVSILARCGVGDQTRSAKGICPVGGHAAGSTTPLAEDSGNSRRGPKATLRGPPAITQGPAKPPGSKSA